MFFTNNNLLVLWLVLCSAGMDKIVSMLDSRGTLGLSQASQDIGSLYLESLLGNPRARGNAV